MSGIKVTAEDRWFSLYIRARDRWQCQKCGRAYRPWEEFGDNSHLRGLHNAHMFGRGAHMTRWDENNTCALCYGCHAYLDSHPIEKTEFFRKRLGDELFSITEFKSHQTYFGWKKDAKQIEARYKKMFFDLVEQSNLHVIGRGV